MGVDDPGPGARQPARATPADDARLGRVRVDDVGLEVTDLLDTRATVRASSQGRTARPSPSIRVAATSGACVSRKSASSARTSR